MGLKKNGHFAHLHKGNQGFIDFNWNTLLACWVSKSQCLILLVCVSVCVCPIPLGDAKVEKSFSRDRKKIKYYLIDNGWSHIRKRLIFCTFLYLKIILQQSIIVSCSFWKAAGQKKNAGKLRNPYFCHIFGMEKTIFCCWKRVCISLAQDLNLA